jgi:hypothetical protein
MVMESLRTAGLIKREKWDNTMAIVHNKFYWIGLRQGFMRE